MRKPFTATVLRMIFLIPAFLTLQQNLVAQADTAKLNIEQLTGNFYCYTTYNTYENSRVPAIGMYLCTSNGVVLFDTPWDTTQFQPLLDSIENRHHQKVLLCIATHWHSDRTEGLDYYRKQGISTYTTVLTDQLCQQNGKKRAAFLISRDTTFQVGHSSFETFYPGEGHTKDNIVIWFKKERILYGGCLIKGADAESLGYLGDANVKEYANTLKRVQKKFPDPKYIVVSHSDSKSSRSLMHSIIMAQKLSSKLSRH